MYERNRPLTPAMEDYLRAIYDLSQERKPVHTTTLARHLRVAPASVTGMLKRLAALGLVRHERYGGAELTEAGERIALQVMRHHRIIETYLSEALGIGWDEVHQEAHRLEHHISPDLQERMAVLLGHPQRDPHGSPIPPREGPFEPPRRSPLSQAQPHARLVVREVLDIHGETLRRLAALGIRPDVELEVIAAPPEGPITVRVADCDQPVDLDLARAVFVDVVE